MPSGDEVPSATMKETSPQPLTIEVGKSTSVSALLTRPPRPRACFVFAHGAGAGMTHPFMEAVATGLYERGIATLRYQFPYMEKGSKRPDPPAVAHAAVRAAVAEAARACPGVPLIAGGKSFGGRMTSQAQAKAPLAGVAASPSSAFRCIRLDKPSERSRRSSRRRANPDAVPAGHERQAGGARACSSRS